MVRTVARVLVFGEKKAMTNGGVRGGKRRRALAWSAGLAVVAGLIVGWHHLSPARAEKKAPAKKPGASKKPEAPGTRAVVDQLAQPDGAAQVAYINEEIRKKWQETKIKPSPRCSDYEFIRRASLDLIGRIARPAEIAKFMSDPPAKRRSLLIERLIDSDEYSKNWANLWTVWLMTRSGAFNPTLKIYHEQMHVWLDEQFANKDLQYDKLVSELLTASGKTNENQAVNFILTHLGEPIQDNPLENGRYDMVPITSRTTRMFLGLRTQCTQCHDHPFNDDWKQADFWGVNAFFRQVDAPKGRPMGRRNQMMTGQLELVDNPELNAEGMIYFERRNGVVLPTKSVFLDGRVKMPEIGKDNTRRKELARFIIKSDYFAKAFINRMWAHFFGRGLTKVFDDFGEHNPVSHPELLDKLAADFKKYNYRPRDLLRWICNSQAYGLSSVANETNDKEDAEPYFAHMQLKAMSPEQLFESLMVATAPKVADNRMEKKKLRDSWMKRLVDNFGDDEGNEATFNGTVVQALLMMNGDDINRAITDPKTGTVAGVVKRYRTRPREAMRSLYIAALNRPPTTAEYERVLSRRVIAMPRVLVRDSGKFYTEFYQDLFWALLNSNEFILNH
jgi:hypothetical protein